MDKYYADRMSLRLKGDSDIIHDPSHAIPENIWFKLYTMDISYFSGKIEMYCRYKGIPFQRIEPHSYEHETILAKNTGSEQLPQLYDCRNTTSENKRWMRDTTPMIEYLEQDEMISKNSLSILPDCNVQKFFQFLFEDYCDEFLWRPAMFMRWEPSFDCKIMGLRFFYEFTRTQQSRYRFVPEFIRPYLASKRQWLLSSHGEGCDTDAKKDVIINQYYELLEVLEEILETQPFLFGNYPTLIDIGFMGPMFKHFSSDPTPRKIMQQFAPNVYEWVGRVWNCKSKKLKDLDINANFPESGTLPKNWNKLLNLLHDYLEYYHLNAQAYNDKKENFEWTFKGETCTVPMVPYRAWCRNELIKKFNACDKKSQDKIKEILQECNCFDLLFKDGSSDIEPECGTHPPFVLHPPPEKREVLSYKWNFTPIMTSYFVPNITYTGITIGITGIVLTGSYFLKQYISKKK